MKLGSCIHLEELRSTQWSDFYSSLTFVEFLCLGHFFLETIRSRAMKLGSCIHLEELI